MGECENQSIEVLQTIKTEKENRIAFLTATALNDDIVMTLQFFALDMT